MVTSGLSGLRIRNLVYKVLLLPNIEALPLNTLKRVGQYVEGGGTVIALDRLPEFSTGFIQGVQNDQKIKRTVSKLFGRLNGKTIESSNYGKGKAYYLKK